MTTYPLDYFDKTTGTLEQLVLATVTQSLVNKDYVLNIIKDFTTESIKWDVVVSANESDNPTAYLNLNLTFATLPFDRQMLTDAPSFDRRIASMNALNIDTLSLPHQPTYPLRSFPAQLPVYLEADDIQNTLERRLMALIVHARDVQNWIARWNYWASQWFISKFFVADNVFRPYSFPTLIEIEAIRDSMLLELSTSINYQPVPLEVEARNYRSVPTNPGNVQAEIELLNSDSPNDPAASSPSVAEDLRNQLEQQFSSFASNSFDFVPQAATPTELPSLPDC